MKKAKLLCKTDAWAINDFFWRQDGSFAFLYQKKRNGKIYRYGKIEKPNILSQEEMASLIDGINDRIAALPPESYNKSRRVLINYKTNEKWFVTPQKKYGPYYEILRTAYKSPNRFHFTFRKNENDQRFFYNLNGKEIASFCGKKTALGAQVSYDSKGRAVLDSLQESYVLIDGKEKYFFDDDVREVCYTDKNIFGYELIWAKNVRSGCDEIIYNKNHVVSVGDWIPLKYGSIAYVKLDSRGRRAWFVFDGKKDVQISAWVQGENPMIIGNTVLYSKGPRRLERTLRFCWRKRIQRICA